MILAQWAAGFCAVATSIPLASIAIAGHRCRRRNAPPAMPRPAPPVTVLRPVCGIEPFVGETLSSSLQLDYAPYELIFCVARADDPVVPVVRGLIEGNPQVRARLLVGDDRISANPKLNNLVKG